MKELIQIIEQLDAINRQIIEKDNLIDQMQGIVDLISQLMHDAQFIQSPIYLDLRAKYFSRIEDHLKKINEASTIIIEPQNLLPSMPSVPPDRTDKSSKDKRTFTRDDVKAPIATDIYMAPTCRVVFSRKKDKDASNKIVPDTTVQETCTSSSLENDAYFSFDFQEQKYYLSSRQTPSHDGKQYAIYDEKMSIVGSLQGATMTITREIKSGTFQTATHILRTCDKMDRMNQSSLFGSYCVERSS